MDDQNNALELAGKKLAEDEFIEKYHRLFRRLGQADISRLLKKKTAFAEALLYKQLKDEQAHKSLGLSWDKFCLDWIKVSRPTVDICIRNLEEFGREYFELNQMMRVSPKIYRQLQITDGKLDVDGELFALNAKNADVIAEAVDQLKESGRVAKRKEAEQRAAATKARQERDEARKTADAWKDKDAEQRRREKELFPGADDNHRTILLAATHIDGRLETLRGLSRKDLSEDNQARLIGYIENLYRQVIQLGGGIRANFGVAINARTDGDGVYLDELPEGRDVITEFVDSKRGVN